MKRVVSIVLLVLIGLNLSSKQVLAAYDKDYFVVTAYYSPLPGQDYYLTGDYEAEKRLNGQGIRGASGKPVFSGMLAAPKNYAFGTKIYLDGLGVGIVEDRGGAIVNAGNRGYSYDRIDVWVGYGDEGLRRALYWGKRTVKGTIIKGNTKSDLDYTKIPAPKWATNGLKKIPNIFSKGLGKGSDANLVKKLQSLLLEVGMYKGEVNGIYNNDVIDIIYDFQIQNNIIKPGEYHGAGYWGKQTRALFLKKYLNGEFDESGEQKTQEIEKNAHEQEVVEVEKNDFVDKIKQIEEKELDLEVFSGFTATVINVKKLQNILIELGYYKGEPTGIYKDTYDPVYDFQIEKGIVTSVYTPGAGNFGPKTRAAMKQAYISFKQCEKDIEIEKLKKQEEEKQEALRIEKEKQEAESRQKELEEKYKKLEEISLKKAEEKMKYIGTPLFGEVSHAVRELQVTLKELGFFNVKDTAIYGPVTKSSIIAYQIDRKIITSENDTGAGLFGPKTKEILKNDLKEMFMQEMIAKENISELEIVSLQGSKM